MNSNNSIVAYYGHHKCASSWFRRIFEDVGRWTGKRFEGFDNPTQFDNNLGARIDAQQLDLISFTNAEMKFVKPLGEHKGVHFIRDPRDVLVSAYFSHLNSHSTDNWQELIPHRERLQNLNQDAGLLAEMEFSECYLRQMYEWDYQQSGILEVRFEEVTIHPYETTLEIFEHLGLMKDEDCKPLYRLRDFGTVMNISMKRRTNGLWPIQAKKEFIPSHQLLTLVHQQRYKKLAGGRKKGQENAKSHYRKGKSGDWSNYFTPAIQQAFDQRYPYFLEKLGYK